MNSTQQRLMRRYFVAAGLTIFTLASVWFGLSIGSASFVGLMLLLWAVAEYPDALTPLRYTVAGAAGGMALGGSLQLFAQAHYVRVLALVKGEGMRSDSASGSTQASVAPPGDDG